MLNDADANRAGPDTLSRSQHPRPPNLLQEAINLAFHTDPPPAWSEYFDGLSVGGDVLLGEGVVLVYSKMGHPQAALARSMCQDIAALAADLNIDGVSRVEVGWDPAARASGVTRCNVPEQT